MSGPGLYWPRKNIKRYDLENLIEARLGDGFGPIDETECDVAVIAGMGGALIRNILAGYPERQKGAVNCCCNPTMPQKPFADGFMKTVLVSRVKSW